MKEEITVGFREMKTNGDGKYYHMPDDVSAGLS